MLRPSKSITARLHVSSLPSKPRYSSSMAAAGRVLVRTAALPVSGTRTSPFSNRVIGSSQPRRHNAFPFQQRVNFGHSSSPRTAQVENQGQVQGQPQDQAPTTPALSGTFADLFCGIGAATMALSGLGLKCVYANDNNILAARTYEKNHRSDQEFVDRRNFVDAVQNHLEDIPRSNVIAASLPTRWHYRYSEENRDDLRLAVDSLLRLVHHQRNEVVMLEFEKKTVTRTRSTAKSNSTNDSAENYSIEHFCTMFDQAGYWVDWQSYSAGSFGLPQYRNHVVALAVRKDLIPSPFRPLPAKNEPDLGLELKDVLLSYEDYQRLNRDRYWPIGYANVPEIVKGVYVLNHYETNVRTFQLQRKKPRRLLLDHRNPLERPPIKDRYNQLRVGLWEIEEGLCAQPHNRERIYHQKGWAGMITERFREMPYYLTSGPDDGHGGVIPCIRHLHPREGARLMGLPDSFALPGDQTPYYNRDWGLVGVSVPPKLLQWPLLTLAQAHPHLFESGSPQK
ncbi:hypothetical protein PspLS_11320 [Pyricularia sp. CBS 133598]|nr:hypothetical protein PspLS_11320 [Pyricularia sp. CBS 133598]